MPPKEEGLHFCWNLVVLQTIVFRSLIILKSDIFRIHFFPVWSGFAGPECAFFTFRFLKVIALLSENERNARNLSVKKKKKLIVMVHYYFWDINSKEILYEQMWSGGKCWRVKESYVSGAQYCEPQLCFRVQQMNGLQMYVLKGMVSTRTWEEQETLPRAVAINSFAW